MDKTISPIALDLGGINTGVYLSHYVAGALPSAEESSLTTIVMPEEGGKMTWSQVGRTATRHRLRSNKRAKLAKRLLKQIFLNGLQHQLSQEEWTALSGLLNRRGYNRTEVELDLSLLERIDPYPFSELLPNFFTLEPLAQQWEAMLEKVSLLRDLQTEPAFTISKKEAKTKLFTDYDKDEQKQLLEAYHLLQEAVGKALDNADFGHQHRLDYLKDIAEEITQDKRLAALTQKFGTQNLHRIIGHVSNLQLRTLRWYFNDKTMAQGDRYDDKRFKDVLQRWLQGWHTNHESRVHRDLMLQTLASHQNTLAALQQLDALHSIPPYEDQNNRRPPKDQTLWLNPLSLNQQYGETWRLWANNLRKTNPHWFEGLETPFTQADGKRLFERKSRLAKQDHTQATWPEYRDAIFLQRMLDRSKAHDPYALRLICQNTSSQSAQNALNRLAQDIGNQHQQAFLAFCQRYYQELELAKQGLWITRDTNLFESADINPPSKKKILHLLVGNVLQHQFDEQSFNDFLTQTWKTVIVGRSTLRSICQKAEEVRKEQGNLFNSHLQRIKFLIKANPKAEKSLKGAEKDIWNLHKNCEKAAAFLAQALGHNEVTQSKYANSFSLAQLFTLIETDRHGFSKVTLAAHQELNWRMQMLANPEGELAARCSRLVSNTVRPFDGVLRRLLDRQAYEIARLKADQIKRLGVRTKHLSIPIIAEENRFTFSVGLADLKKNGTKRKKLLELQDKQASRWQDKQARIQHNQYCPYTGELIGHIGEIDHILPRAYSRDHSGTVFDSEANLIWCSRKGNQRKQDQRYCLHDLKAPYLMEQFGTQDLASISTQIEATLAKLGDELLFQNLTAAEQRDVRHALFLADDSPAFQKAKRSLASQQKSRVNGTQAWLVRSIMEKLNQHLTDWCQQHKIELTFCAARVNAESTSQTRRLLANHNPIYTKQMPQPVASHAIDAVCALAVAAATLKQELALSESLQEDPALIEQLINSEVAVHWVERKARYEKNQIASQPLFKEGIYAEDFLPIWSYKNGICVGFDPNTNAVQWQSKAPDQLINLLLPVLDQAQSAPLSLNAAKPTKLSINKDRAFSLLAKVARERGTDDERALADLLDALRYCTAKKECKSKIYDPQKKAFNSKEDILKEKAFVIGLKYSQKQYGKLSGKLRLPAYYDWLRLLNTPQIAPYLGNKHEEPDWLAMGEDFFHAGSKRPHSKTRRVFSLPMLDNPSGGYRIRRCDPDGLPVWQLMAIEGTGAAGFAVYDGKIDWSRPVAIPALAQSQVTAIAERWQPSPDDLVRFDAWLPIRPLPPEIVGLFMAPGTKDRRYIRVQQSFTSFQRWLATAEIHIENPISLPSAINVDGAKFQSNHSNELLGKPRSNLFIEQIGAVVTYWYIVESSSSSMKNAYQEAYSQRNRD